MSTHPCRNELTRFCNKPCKNCGKLIFFNLIIYPTVCSFKEFIRKLFVAYLTQAIKYFIKIWQNRSSSYFGDIVECFTTIIANTTILI